MCAQRDQKQREPNFFEDYEDLSNAFYDSYQKHRNRVAVIEKVESEGWLETSYADLFDKTKQVEQYLLRGDRPQGRKIAVYLENGTDWVSSFFGILSAGCICVPLNVDWDLEQIKQILEDCACEEIITDKKMTGKLGEEQSSFQINNIEDIRECEGQGQDLKRSSLVPEEACILYTSGTTSEPKGVVLTQKNLLANAESIRKIGMILPEDRLLSGLPLYHVYPLMVSMIMPLLNGSTVIYLKELTGTAIKDALEKTEPTFFVVVPQIISRMYRTINEKLEALPLPVRGLMGLATRLCGMVRSRTGLNLGKHLFASIHKKMPAGFRMFATGGAKLEREVEEFFAGVGHTVAQGYGMTEAAPVISYNPVESIRIGSVGKAVPGVEIKIDLEDKEYNTGEVLVRGENIMKGYYGKEDLTSKTLKDGWLHTGDLGYLEDGYLFLTGRKKEVIVLENGKNIYPEHIEKSYLEKLPIEEICVVDRRSPKTGKTSLHAIVRPDRDRIGDYGAANFSDSVKKGMDKVSRQLGPNERVSSFTVTFDPLPRTSLGKLKRYDVKRKYESDMEGETKRPERELSAEDRRFLEDDFNRKIVDVVKKIGESEKVYPGDLLEEVGIDSLGRIDLSEEVEKELGQGFPEEVFTSAFTVRELAESLKDISAAGKRSSSSSGSLEDKVEELPSEKTLNRIDLSPGLWSRVIAWAILIPLMVIMKVFFRLRSCGGDNVPEEGPFILYANHTSFLDGFLIASALKRKPRMDLFFMGYRFFFEVPVIRRLLKAGRIIPIDMGDHMLEALRSSYYVLEKKKGICLFPEGTRNEGDELLPFKKGFGIVSNKANTKLVPIYIKGAKEAWPVNKKWPRPHPVSVHIGQALSLDMVAEKGHELGVEDRSEAVAAGAREMLKEKIASTR